MSTAVAALPPALPLPVPAGGIAMSTPPSRIASVRQHSQSPLTTKSSSEANKPSPTRDRNPSSSIPKVTIKQEPAPPPPTNTESSHPRPRPRRLDLSTNIPAIASALSARPLNSKEIQDVGYACLSPGINTSNPQVKQQLQRSMDVREQQRLIIEARQRGLRLPSDTTDLQPPPSAVDSAFDSARPTPPLTSRRKGPPPALSIAPPHHAHFAHERGIQSAPLNMSFPRHLDAATGPSHLRNLVANDPHPRRPMQHMPAIQTSNRLPPIADVFPTELQSSTSARNGYNLSPAQINQPLTSPGYPPHFQQQQQDMLLETQHSASIKEATQKPPTSSARTPRPPPGLSPLSAHNQTNPQPFAPQTHAPSHRISHHGLPQKAIREFKTADEAMRAMAGGREDLLPRIVHYNGRGPSHPSVSPPTRPGYSGALSATEPRIDGTGSGRRRDREEYEADASSPLTVGRLAKRPVSYAEHALPVRDSPDAMAVKKEQFMKLVEQAWDLFHS